MDPRQGGAPAPAADTAGIGTAGKSLLAQWHPHHSQFAIDVSDGFDGAAERRSLYRQYFIEPGRQAAPATTNKMQLIHRV
jgi:hypothetical protein